MDIRRAFTKSAFLLVLTGILSLSIAEGSPLLIGGAMLLALLAYKRAELDRRPLGRLGTNLLVAAVIFLFVPFDYLAITGSDPIVTLTHFLLAVQVVMLFGKKAARQWYQLFTVSLMQLGVSAVLTIELAFSIGFVVYMIVGTWTLVLFHLVRELDRCAPDERATIRSGRGLLGATALVSLGALGLTVFIFLAFPRFTAVIFNVRRAPRTERVSGFTEQIGLTDLTEIKESEAVVLNVTPEGSGDRFPAEPKWRGLSFDRYEKGRWTRSWHAGGGDPLPNPSVQSLPRFEGYNPRTEGPRWDLIRVSPPRAPPAPSEIATYSIWQVPLSLKPFTLFGVPDVESVQFLSADRATRVTLDRGDAIYAEALPPTDVKYRVRSAPVRRDAAKAVAEPPVRRRVGAVDYLQLPETPAGAPPERDLAGRLKTLAAEVVADAGAKTPYEKAEALERFLRVRFEYTLDVESGPRESDPILHFLFTTKRGHCELSASAFVLMCRTLGLHARLVNGFQTGVWNDYLGAWQVRQMDAHAWAEVWFGDGAGWVDFDPTPWAIDGMNPVLTALEKMREYLRVRWLNYVISYKLSDQLSFADRLRERLQGLRAFIRDAARQLRRALPELRADEIARVCIAAALATGLIAAAIILARRWSAKPGAGANGRRPGRPVPFFDELLKILERKGFRRQPAETAREFAARVARDGGGAWAEVPVVAEAFYRVRYGEIDLGAEERGRVEAILVGLVNPGARRGR